MSVILTQTDTTVGFLSQDATKLQTIKSRTDTKPFIKVYKNFKSFPPRIPTQYKNIVRRARKTTFIVKNNAFRVSQPYHKLPLLNAPWYYSTSANAAGKSFERVFCEAKADIIIEDKQRFHENKASSLIKLTQKAKRRLR